MESLTVVDLVRMTLGVGPCQYILDLEGQKRNSRGVATCYARDIINAIYKEGTQLQQRPRDRGAIWPPRVAFITNVRERIDQYVQVRPRHERVPGRAETPPSAPRRVPRRTAAGDQRGSISSSRQNRERIRTPAYAQQSGRQLPTRSC